MNCLKSLLPYIVLALLVLIAYFNTLCNDFVYDDASVIAENPRVFKLTNVRYVFSPLYFKLTGKGKEYAFGEASYRPAVTLTYFFDAFVFKGKSIGCHLTNLLLHLANVLLLYSLIKKLILSRIAGLTGALLFSVHPVVTESVNAIGFREDLLVLLCILSGAVMLIGKPKSRYCIKLFFYDLIHSLIFATALFSKESAVVYPITLAGLSYIKKISWRENRFLFLMLGCTLCLYLVVRFILLDNPHAEPLAYPGGTMTTNIYTMLKVFTGYIGLLLYPMKLLADHHIPVVRHFSAVPFTPILLTAVILLISGYSFIKERKIWAYGVIWFLVNLLPVMNIIKIVNISAERYLYIPLAGIAISTGMLFLYCYKKFKKKILIATIILITAYSCRTIVRNSDWRDTLSLWNSTLRVEPKSHRALSNLATYYFDHKDYRKAIRYYLRALEQRASAIDRYNLANCYVQIEDYMQAEKEYSKSLTLDPTNPSAYNNLALLLVKMGRYDQAESTLKTMLLYKQIDSGYFENLGLVYDAKGEYDMAIEQYRKSIELKRNNPSAYNKLAVAYFKKGDILQGIEVCADGIEKFPDDINLHKNMAVMYNILGDHENETIYWQKAYEIESTRENLMQKIKASQLIMKTGNTKVSD
ncbi:MAG: tetratricopeptide repeat protein [Candidatus Auribacterota bacterium]|nr:tetratricopeptide repeat protein [Candidatus Auribacterota bacterium]